MNYSFDQSWPLIQNNVRTRVRNMGLTLPLADVVMRGGVVHYRITDDNARVMNTPGNLALSLPDMEGLLLQFYPVFDLVAGGTKVYRPSPEEFNLLSTIDPCDITLSHVKSPYRSLAVAIPTECMNPDLNNPCVVVVTFCQDIRHIVFGLYGWGGGEFGPQTVTYGTVTLTWTEADEKENRTVADLTFVSTIPDQQYARAAMRVVFNTMAMLTNYRHTLEDHSVPERGNRQQRREARVRNELLPKVIRFSQNVVLQSVATQSAGGEREGGHEVTCHWRRGHWAQQPCGPKQSERKLIFRRPTLVRADRFGGDPGDTTVTYTKD